MIIDMQICVWRGRVGGGGGGGGVGCVCVCAFQMGKIGGIPTPRARHLP